MARRVKEKRKVFCKDDVKLSLQNTFIYEITIFKTIYRSYNLQDTRTVETKKHSKDKVTVFYKKKVRYTRYTQLKAAPEWWLVENNYKENEQIN
jgi:hypothetical protein